MKNPHTVQRFAKTFAQFMPPAFKTGIVLMVFAAMILAGIPLIALVLAGIGMLLEKRTQDANEGRADALPAPDKPAPTTNNPSAAACSTKSSSGMKRCFCTHVLSDMYPFSPFHAA